MATFFDNQDKEKFFAPFGPGIGKIQLSASYVNKMNKIIDDLSKREEPLKDFSDNLVGKVDEELLFDDHMKEIFLEETRNFISKYAQWMEFRNSLGARKLDSTNNRYGIQFISGWVVRQREGEYNPIHIHTGCKLSCVGYLSLPEGIEKEWEEDYKDHHPSHGHIQFVHGTPSNWSTTNFMVKPQIGDFFLFPSDLFHCVYPFYTPGERRSFSVNLNFLEMPENG
jgi:hypothetical protein